MPKKLSNALTPLQVKSAKSGRHADGGGLHRHCHINLVKAQDWFWFYDQAFRAAAFQPLNAPARNFLNKGRLIRWR